MGKREATYVCRRSSFHLSKRRFGQRCVSSKSWVLRKREEPEATSDCFGWTAVSKDEKMPKRNEWVTGQDKRRGEKQSGGESSSFSFFSSSLHSSPSTKDQLVSLSLDSTLDQPKVRWRMMQKGSGNSCLPCHSLNPIYTSIGPTKHHLLTLAKHRTLDGNNKAHAGKDPAPSSPTNHEQ